MFLDRPTLSLNHDKIVKPCIAYANNVPDFFEAEAIGLNTPRKCQDCQACTQFHITDSNRTVQEQMELQLLEKAVCLDEERQRIEVTYPIIGDTSKFFNNYK